MSLYHIAYGLLAASLYGLMVMVNPKRRLAKKEQVGRQEISKRHGRVVQGIHNHWLKYLRIKSMRQSEHSNLIKALNVVTKLMNHRVHRCSRLNLALWMLLGAGLGWWLGMLLENLFVSVLLAFVGMVTPFFYLQNRIRAYERDLNEKLLLVLSSLQGEYMKPHTPFIHAVTAVLPTIPDPLYQPFKKYADPINLFHPDSPIEALKVLEQAINNYFFTEYICLAMLAEEGEHGLKATMCAIPDEYQGYLETNRAFSYKVARYNQNFQMTLLTFPLMIGFLKVASEDYFKILVHHPMGKLTLAGLTMLYLGAALIFNKLNADVKLEL